MLLTFIEISELFHETFISDTNDFQPRQLASALEYLDASKQATFVEKNLLRKIEAGTLDLKQFSPVDFLKQASVIMDHFPVWRKRMYEFAIAKV